MLAVHKDSIVKTVFTMNSPKNVMDAAVTNFTFGLTARPSLFGKRSVDMPDSVA